MKQLPTKQQPDSYSSPFSATIKQRRTGPTSLNTASSCTTTKRLILSYDRGARQQLSTRQLVLTSEDLKVQGRLETNTVEGLCPPPAPPAAASPSAAGSPSPPPRCFRLPIAGVVGKPWEVGLRSCDETGGEVWGLLGQGFLVENRRDAVTWAWASSMFGSIDFEWLGFREAKVKERPAEDFSLGFS